MLQIVEVYSGKYLQDIRSLFKEYANSLGFDLQFQDFNKEFEELPGEYSAPYGCLYIALWNDKVVGCIALRKLSNGVCEMKRMYVRPSYRRKGIGRSMAMIIIKRARAMGYKKMRLDTIDTMKAAIALYKSLGFKDINSYRYNPIHGAQYMELVL